MILPFRRSLATFASAAMMTSLLAGSYPPVAQEGASKTQTNKVEAKSEPSAPEKARGKVAPPDPTHRVPPGYSKLNLSEEQKLALYKIQAKYYSQIQKLEKEADDLRDKREKECEAVLKPAQKRHLLELEKEKKDAATARKAAAAREAEKEREKP